jgi:sugar lactone lactonase YvrE
MKHTSKVFTRLLCVVLFSLFGSSATAQPASRMYWADAGAGKFQRANLDGTSVEDLITGLGNPQGIALDLAGGKMYLTGGGTGKIQRANLDGTGVEHLVTVVVPIRIALDLAGGKMYWTDHGTGKIQRANLDGTGVDDLVTGVSDSHGLALDLAGGKMYWTERPGLARVRRANLDGTGVEALVTTGLSDPRGLALDLAGGKMYWADLGTGKIQRANLDGTSVEDLITGLGNPEGLALDLAGGKMYWTDFGADKIRRANLDGSGVEDLVTTGLVIPTGIALELEEVLRVAIDIKPGSDPNAVNPAARGLIPVAVLTTESFDALTVSPSSVQFGPNGASMVHRSGHLEDVDSDGDLDLVLHFRTQETGIQCGDTSASLTGETFDGQAIQGSDSLVTVGCN